MHIELCGYWCFLICQQKLRSNEVQQLDFENHCWTMGSICFNFQFICAIVPVEKMQKYTSNAQKEVCPLKEKQAFCVLPINNLGRWSFSFQKKKPIYLRCHNNQNCSDRNKKMLDFLTESSIFEVFTLQNTHHNTLITCVLFEVAILLSKSTKI